MAGSSAEARLAGLIEAGEGWLRLSEGRVATDNRGMAASLPMISGGNMTSGLKVHDPRGYPPKVTGKRLAPRPAGLEGKVLYLVDCLFDNSEAFMEQLRQWLAAHLPLVETRLVKPRESWVDDADMRVKIASEGNAAILGVGL